ncbi:type IV pilus modification PilV family protein [Planococcus salinus]|uniref:type IV pilus modification PilV family protein n=1 Tax=Planococcus salinus TaxID=1848460 RepID=UPI0023D9409A|nr:type II secretion system protein [Planococcus salinus]
MLQANSKNEQGLTLVEVLAALVVLGILFVGIMTIFPQMTVFNAKTETKLDTMNLARQEVAKIVAEETWRTTLPVSSAFTDTEENLFRKTMEIEMPEMGYALEEENSDYLRYTKSDDYFYEVDIYRACEPYWSDETEETLSCNNLDLRQLYKVHLKVYNSPPLADGTYQMSSETYSYIRFVVESSGVAE